MNKSTVDQEWIKLMEEAFSVGLTIEAVKEYINELKENPHAVISKS